MGKMDISFDSELLTLEPIADGELSKKMLLSAAPHVKAVFKNNLEKAIGSGNRKKDRSTGELLSSVGITGVRKNRDGYWDIKIGVSGKDSNGVRNGLKAGVLEHGKSNQPARPFARPTVKQVKNHVYETMRRVLDEELKKNGNTQ